MVLLTSFCYFTAYANPPSNLDESDTALGACWHETKLQAPLSQRVAPSMLYIWSPRMVLSVNEAHFAQQAAAEHALRFVPIIDARVPTHEWQAALKHHPNRDLLLASQPFCSHSLLAHYLVNTLGSYSHAPSSFILHPNKNDNTKNKTLFLLDDRRIVGAMEHVYWIKSIKERLSKPQSSDIFLALAPDSSQQDLLNLMLKAASPAPQEAQLPAKDANSVPQTSSFSENATASDDAKQCIAKNEFVTLTPEIAGQDSNGQAALGSYERVSPDGRYILRSFSGERFSAVSLIELPAPAWHKDLPVIHSQVTRILNTPLQNEAFPVQGSWRYLVSPNGEHYTFKSIVEGAQNNHTIAKPLFKAGMTGFYAAAAEVDSTYPEKSTEIVRIRSLSWPNSSANSESQGEGALSSRTYTVNPIAHEVIDKGKLTFLCSNRSRIDGTLYALPMISVDGHEFATLPQIPLNNQPTMHIFDFGASGNDCVLKSRFPALSGKSIFGFPNKNKDDNKQTPLKQLAPLAYEFKSQIWWVPRSKNHDKNAENPNDTPSSSAHPLNIAPNESEYVGIHKVFANAFPAISADGRIIYAASWLTCGVKPHEKNCTPTVGYIISDPWQSNAFAHFKLAHPDWAKNAPLCITKQAVLHEREQFTRFHGLSN